ncbi:MAG: hypothetical protein VYB46_08510 [Pseudomonadota bacterium]|nr:hypothetical protein [Pseudomonadota bacterium]
MALSYPYALDFLANCLGGERIPLALQRFDERSGSGDGRFWSAQMATPLWGATYPLYAQDAAHAREINAKVYALDGMSKTLLWADPYYGGPASGMTSGLGAATIIDIRGTDRGAIAFTGVPEGFVLSAGDYLSIAYGSGRMYFGTFVEGGTASSAGTIWRPEVRPYLPLNIATGARIELVRPNFRAMVTDFTPFANFRGRWGDSASITILQKP